MDGAAGDDDCGTVGRTASGFEGSIQHGESADAAGQP